MKLTYLEPSRNIIMTLWWRFDLILFLFPYTVYGLKIRPAKWQHKILCTWQLSLVNTIFRYPVYMNNIV